MSTYSLLCTYLPHHFRSRVLLMSFAQRLNYRESVDGHGLYEEEVVLSGSGSAPLASIRFAAPATTKTSYMMKDTLRSGKESKVTRQSHN